MVFFTPEHSISVSQHKINTPDKASFNLLRCLIMGVMLMAWGVGSVSATKTASVTGNWSNTATWGGAAVPTNSDDVVINSGITVTMDANPGYCNNLTISNSANLTWSGSGTLNVAANFTNNGGTLSPGTGTVTMTGTPMSIGGTASTTFNNLYLGTGGSQRYSLGNSQTVNGILTISNNVILTLGVYNLMLGASASIGNMGSMYSGCMIIANGSGKIQKMFTGTGSFTFPIGDVSSNYSPITLNFTSGIFSPGTAYVSVNVTNSKHPQNLSPTNYLNRYWTISQSGITSFSCNITGTWTNSDCMPNTGSWNLQNAVEYTGSLPWINYSGLTSNTLTANGVTTFGDFTGMGIPSFTTNTTSITGFTYASGQGPTTGGQAFYVNSNNLTSPFLVTPPPDFEVSLSSGSSYQSTPLTVPQSGGVINNIPVYVRLKAGLVVGTYSNEIIVCSSTGATNINVTVSGSVTPSAYYSIGSGNWNSNTTWSFNSGGGAVPSGAYPQAGDNVYIERGQAVTVNIPNATCTNLTLGGQGLTGSLTFAGTGNPALTVSGAVQVGGTDSSNSYGFITFVNGASMSAGSLSMGYTTNSRGTVTMTAGSTLTLNGAITVSGTGTKTWTPSTGTVIMNATNTLPSTIFTTFNNLTCNAGNTTMGVGLAINGNLSIADGATFTAPGYALSVAGTTTVGSGTSGTLAISSATGTKTFTGAVTVNSGGALTESAAAILAFGSDITINLNSTLTEFGAATVVIAGNFTNNGTYYASSGVHTLSGTTKTIGGTSTNTIPSAAFSGTYTNTGTLTIGTALTGGGGLTQAVNSTLYIGGTSTITTLTATNSGNTVNYTGTGQTLNVIPYYNLTLSGGAETFGAITTIGGNLTLSGAATATTGAALTVGGNLNIGDGTTNFTAAGFALTVTGTTTVGGGTSGSLDISSATGTKTFTGAVIINIGADLTESANAQLAFGSDVTINGTLTENGSAVVGIAGSLTNNGTYTASTGIHTFSGSTKSIGGTSTNTIPSAAFTGTCTNTGTLTVGTALTGGGGLTQAANSALYIGGTSTITTLAATASGNKVNYNGGAQTACIVTTYDNLTISGSNAKTFLTTPTINNVLSMEGTASVVVTGTGVVTYGANATLQYNKPASYTATSEEWITPFTATGGIIIANTGSITMNNVANVLNANVPLTINSGATLTIPNYLLTLGGNFTNNGTFTSGTSGVILGGNLINNGTFTGGSGGVTITGTATTQSIDGFTTTGTVTMTKAAGTATFTDNVNGAGLTINGTGGTLNLGVGLTHTFTGDITLTAGTLNGGSSMLNENHVSTTAWGGTGSLFTAGTGTVTFGASGAQTLSATATTFNNIVLGGSGTKTFSSTYITTTNGDFSILSGVTANLGTGITHKAGTLTLAGTEQTTGLWGGGSNATKNSTYFTNNGTTSGLLNVSSCDGLWTGSTGTDWNTPSNWCSGNVPTSTTNVTINSGGNQPTIGATGGLCKNITINSGATLTISGSNNLTVSGNWTNNGTFTYATGTTTFNGVSQTISGSSTSFYNLTLSGSGTVTYTATAASTTNILTVNSTETLTLNGTTTLTPASAVINGTVIAQNTASLVNGTSTISFTSGSTYQHAVDGGTIPTATWDKNSTCLITGYINTPTGNPGNPANYSTNFSQSFGNFTWNCSSQTTSITLGGALTTINGNLTILSTGSGFLALANTVAGTTNVSGNFILNGGTFALAYTSNTINLNIAGNFTLSGGTLNSGSGTGNIYFTGTSPQTYTSAGGTVTNAVNFTVNNGATLQMGTGSSPSVINGSTGTFTVSAGGTLGVTSTAGITTGTTASGNIQVTGTRTYTTGANYIYNGTGAQVTGNGLTQNTPANITINNSAGVTLSAATSVSGILTLSNGTLTTTSTNLLSIANTATNAISGGSTTSFINGPVKWSLPSGLVSGSTYNFPVGNSSTFLPFALVNPTTSAAATAQVQATTGASVATFDGTLMGKSNTEYWNLVTSANFTNSSVSLTRPSSAIAPNDVIGRSTSLTGTYTSLAGTAGTYGVSGSNSIGGGSTNQYFVFAQSYKSITTGTITGSPFCAGQAVSIPYTISGTYGSGNVFTAQLSGPTGSFSSPVSIGTLASTSAGTISGTIPAGTSYGTGYRIQVVSNTYSVTGTPNRTDLIINSNSIAAPGTTGATTSCIGTVSSLTASGATTGYFYKWYDAPMGGNVLYTSTSYTDNTFTTPSLYSTTSYWVSIMASGGCEGARTQVTATYPSVCTDTQTPGTNSWMGYVYSGYDTNFANNIYFGHYAVAETFNENFGNGGDNYCFSITSNSTPISINTYHFSVRYLMNSTLKGLYAVDLGSDDGSRLTVDNTLIYNNWTDQAYSDRPGVLMNLTGSSTLIYDYYENTGANQVVFQNLTQILANTLTNNTSQSIYVGYSGTAISGDVYGTLPSGITLSGTGYQWTYSTTPSGTRTAISGATAATYMPTATAAPFNTPGTYYLYRDAILSSANNVSPATYVATNESNAATLIVTSASAGNGIITNSSCPLVADGAISLNTPVDYAVQFNHATNDYINLGSSLLNGLPAFTLEGWIKYKSSDFGSYTRVGLFGQNDAIEFGLFSATDLQLYTSIGHPLDITITATTLGDNNWHHVAAVGTSTSITIYIDGVSQGTPTTFTAISSFGTSTDHATIGQVFDAAGTTNETFPGQMRRVGIWNTALSAAQIASLASSYTNTYTGSETGLIAGYNFSEGTGTSVSSLYSSGGTAHTGTFVYSPNWVDLLSPYSWTNTTQTTRNLSGLLMGTYTLTPKYGNGTTGTAEPFTVASNNTCATYWVGGTNSTWTNTLNWSAQYVPVSGADIVFANGTNYSPAAQKELDLDQNRTIGNLTNTSNQALVIPPALCLTVSGNITTSNASNIHIQSAQGKANGSFIFPNASNVQATVDMYSKATALTQGATPSNYQWQYFGIPVTSIATADPTFYGSYVRAYTEGSTAQYGKWTQLTNMNSLTEFLGYEITQANPTTITFQGTLENGNKTINLTNTSGAYDPGQNIIANSYTAAIDVRQLTFGANTEQTIYLYNTGSFGQWTTNTGTGETSYSSDSTVTTPGQYLAIPKNNAGTGKIPYSIPSMSGFLVKATTTGVNGSITINYKSAVITPNVSVQRAPSEVNQTSDKVYMEISLKGKYSGDRMWLVNQPGTTRAFDDGWDGYKLPGATNAPQLFAMEESGNYQISTSEDMSNTYLGFQAGLDLQDTLTFENENLTTKYAAVYLVDLVDNCVTDITKSGTQYAFVTESTPTPVKRFMIITRSSEESANGTDLKLFNSGNTIFVENSGSQNGKLVVYDMMGRPLKIATFSPYGVTAVQTDAIPGAYVVNAATSNEQVTKKFIFGK